MKKTAIILLLFGLFIFATSTSRALISTTKTNPGNLLSTATVDIELQELDSGDTDKPLVATDLTPGDWTDWARLVISTQNSTVVVNQYLYLDNLIGDACSKTNLSITADSNSLFNGAISGLEGVSNRIQINSDYSIIQQQAQLDDSADSSFEGTTCTWDEIFAVENGFSDTATIASNSITTKSSFSSFSTNVVLNEFMPNPWGDDDAPMLGGEWVELFNNGEIDEDVDGWYLYDEHDTHDLLITNSNTLSGSTTVPAGSTLVVYRNGDSNFTLNNDGDTLRLFSGPIDSGTLVDSFTYSDSVGDDETYSRVPDGTGDWGGPFPSFFPGF